MSLPEGQQLSLALQTPLPEPPPQLPPPIHWEPRCSGWQACSCRAHQEAARRELRAYLQDAYGISPPD